MEEMVCMSTHNNKSRTYHSSSVWQNFILALYTEKAFMLLLRSGI